MRWALATAVLAAVGVVVVVVLVVASSRDTVPGRLRACALDGEAAIMHSDADLGGQVRSDAQAGALRVASRTRLGDDTAVLLRGTRYRLLVLAGKGSPGLGGDLPRRLVERTSAYALVAKAAGPADGVLRGCVALVAGP